MKNNFIKYLLIFFLTLTFKAHSIEDVNEFTTGSGFIVR